MGSKGRRFHAETDLHSRCFGIAMGEFGWLLSDFFLFFLGRRFALGELTRVAPDCARIGGPPAAVGQLAGGDQLQHAAEAGLVFVRGGRRV